MGFHEVRRRVIASLRSGLYLHEPRQVALNKNLLQSGQISLDELIDLLDRCRGTQFGASPHHLDQSVMVYVFRPNRRAERWYIKVYFADENTVFISVHRSS